MKKILFALCILIFASCTSSRLAYQHGEASYNPCPQCKNVELTIENPSDVDVVFKIDNKSYKLEPGRRKRIVHPLNLIAEGEKMVSVKTPATVEFNGYVEAIKLFPGQGYDLSGWMLHCYQVRPF